MTVIITQPIEPLVTITPWSLECMGSDILGIGSNLEAATSQAWEVASAAKFFPFTLTKQITAETLFWYNGATVGAYSVDVGIYDTSGNRLVSTGGTTSTPANTVQTVSITSTNLGPGNFYLAITANNTLQTFFCSGGFNARYMACFGMAYKTASNPLPATVSLVTIGGTTIQYIPVFGLSTRSVL